MHTGLLPEGFHDRLPPFADMAARLETRILATAFAHGYERCDPPLAEFEESIGTRLKAASARNAVRFVDPASQRTLAIRPDITAQVGRIAATRMAHHPRPVRLSYAGTVLKLRASPLAPDRALRQIGCELIGLDSVAAAREVVGVAVEALSAAGLGGLSIDFTLPDLVPTLAGERLCARRLAALSEALDAKDAAAVAAVDPAYLPLIQAAGPFDAAIARLRAADTGGMLASRIEGLAAVAKGLEGVSLTLDPTERHGFEYQSWIGFSIFAAGARREIGRGGAYQVMHEDGREEAAIGFSLFVDPILDAGLAPVERRRLFVPVDGDAALAARLRAEGWVTVAALDPADTPAAQLCGWRLGPDGPEPA